MNDRGEKLYLAEYYTLHPTTRTGGWDIKYAWVMAFDRYEVKSKLSKLKDFDAVIQIGEQMERFPLSRRGGIDDSIYIS